MVLFSPSMPPPLPPPPPPSTPAHPPPYSPGELDCGLREGNATVTGVMAANGTLLCPRRDAVVDAEADLTLPVVVTISTLGVLICVCCFTTILLVILRDRANSRAHRHVTFAATSESPIFSSGGSGRRGPGGRPMPRGKGGKHKRTMVVPSCESPDPTRRRIDSDDDDEEAEERPARRRRAPKPPAAGSSGAPSAARSAPALPPLKPLPPPG